MATYVESSDPICRVRCSSCLKLDTLILLAVSLSYRRGIITSAKEVMFSLYLSVSNITQKILNGF